MSTDTTAAESALFTVRESLHALGVPTDDLPDDLVPVAAGGSLMPSLPGWTVRRARDWAVVAIGRPDLARRIIAWTMAHAGQLANLEWLTAWETIAVPGVIVSLGRHDVPPGDFAAHEDVEIREMTGLSGDRTVDEARIVLALDAALARLNHMPRPWHAELAAAIAAAQRGEAVGGPERIVVDGGRSTHPVPTYQLTATTRLRAIPFDFLMRVQGRVNRGPFCGAGPGELLLDGLRTDTVEDGTVPLTYHFAFRPGLPWSRFLRLDGGFAEALDPAGSLAYEMADFFELP